jgi:hypothetical protein
VKQYIARALAAIRQWKIVVVLALVAASIAFLNPIVRGGRTALDVDLDKGRFHLATSSPASPQGSKGEGPKPKSHTVSVKPSGEIIVSFKD